MNKQVSTGFGKKVFLLGTDSNGVRYWLEGEKWDCDWYWGCGYVETFQRDAMPSRARDIDTHQHFNGLFLKGNEKRHYYVDAWNDLFKESVLTENEVWTLMELMKTMYQLKQYAEITGRGGSYLCNNPCQDLLKDPEYTKRVNEVLLPAIFAEVEKLLTPAESEE